MPITTTTTTTTFKGVRYHTATITAITTITTITAITTGDELRRLVHRTNTFGSYGFHL